MTTSATPFTSDASSHEIDVKTLAQKLQVGTENLQLIDVREPWEVETAAIDQFGDMHHISNLKTCPDIKSD